MTNEEILKKAIEKARLNILKNSDEAGIVYKWKNQIDNYYQLIFDHDFARAFWGSEWHHKYEYAPEFAEDPRMIISWQFHLQQMVLEKEPLKYLERFI